MANLIKIPFSISGATLSLSLVSWRGRLHFKECSTSSVVELQRSMGAKEYFVLALLWRMQGFWVVRLLYIYLILSFLAGVCRIWPAAEGEKPDVKFGGSLLWWETSPHSLELTRATHEWIEWQWQSGELVPCRVPRWSSHFINPQQSQSTFVPAADPLQPPDCRQPSPVSFM